MLPMMIGNIVQVSLNNLSYLFMQLQIYIQFVLFSTNIIHVALCLGLCLCKTDQ